MPPVVLGTIAMSVLSVLSALRNTVFPKKCYACGELFEVPGQHCTQDLSDCDDITDLFGMSFRHFLCAGCLAGFEPVTSPLCERCGMMFRERISDDHLCGECIRSPGNLGIARSVGVYDNTYMNVIRAFKYEGKTGLAKPLGRLLFRVFTGLYGGDRGSPFPDLILPVPLHRKRMRSRGFNQAWLIIREWKSFLSEFQGGDSVSIRRGICIRQRQTDPQTGLDKKKRKTNIKGAFAVSQPEMVKGKHVVLIDDVYTTGATSEECASVLLKSGASQVDLLTLARTR